MCVISSELLKQGLTCLNVALSFKGSDGPPGQRSLIETQVDRSAPPCSDGHTPGRAVNGKLAGYRNLKNKTVTANYLLSGRENGTYCYGFYVFF